MARGYDVEAGKIQLVEQGVYNVVQGRTVAQRASYASRIAAASVMLIAAAVVCVTLSGSTSDASTVRLSSIFYTYGVLDACSWLHHAHTTTQQRHTRTLGR
jgi:hypothetical protein